ncbi:MAG TPA: hypothetical protein VMG81_03365 [Thermoplasmata archaeon]|nr:hypothetical protein [Thermoplasmata archaeon]
MTKEELKRRLSCPDCVADPEVECWRNPDVECLECAKRLCAHHVLPHLRAVHHVSVEWRGALKAEGSSDPEPEGPDGCGA